MSIEVNVVGSSLLRCCCGVYCSTSTGKYPRYLTDRVDSVERSTQSEVHSTQSEVHSTQSEVLSTQSELHSA